MPREQGEVEMLEAVELEGIAVEAVAADSGAAAGYTEAGKGTAGEALGVDRAEKLAVEEAGGKQASAEKSED